MYSSSSNPHATRSASRHTTPSQPRATQAKSASAAAGRYNSVTVPGGGARSELIAEASAAVSVPTAGAPASSANVTPNDTHISASATMPMR